MPQGGRPRPRRAIYIPALAAIRFNPVAQKDCDFLPLGDGLRGVAAMLQGKAIAPGSVPSVT